MSDSALKAFQELVYLAGGGDRAFESGRLAITRGDSPAATLDALCRNLSPGAFDAKLALKRQRRAALERK